MRTRSGTYRLKLYDDVLAEFSLRIDEFGELSCEMLDRDESKRALFPPAMAKGMSAESFLEWVGTRTIPKNRKFAGEILAAAGLEPDDAIGILDACKGLSANDSYWLDNGDADLEFGAINLFENPLDEVLSHVAFTGCGTKQRHRAGLSAEFTTDGSYPKAWRRIDGRLVLYKAGTSGFANSGMEPYSEYFSSQIAERMGIPHVEYGLDEWKGALASTCPLLNTKDVSYVPFFQAADPSFPNALAVLSRLDSGMAQAYRSMLVFDAVTANVDRHGANFGVLRDNATGEVLGMAPIFDHNLALFPQEMPADFPDLLERAHGRGPVNSRLGFIDQSGLVMGRAQHEQVARLAGFELRNHPRYPVSEERLAALNAYLAERTRELLKIAPIDEKSLSSKMEERYRKIGEEQPIAKLSEILEGSPARKTARRIPRRPIKKGVEGLRRGPSSARRRSAGIARCGLPSSAYMRYLRHIAYFWRGYKKDGEDTLWLDSTIQGSSAAL